MLAYFCLLVFFSVTFVFGMFARTGSVCRVVSTLFYNSALLTPPAVAQDRAKRSEVRMYACLPVYEFMYFIKFETLFLPFFVLEGRGVLWRGLLDIVCFLRLLYSLST